MKLIPTGVLGIQSGSIMLFSDFDTGGPMWSGHGPREVRNRIDFAETYRDVPHVQVGVSLWDLDSGTNVRMDLGADGVDVDGFTIVFRTWGDTRLARLRVTWTAFGAIADQDVWALE